MLFSLLTLCSEPSLSSRRVITATTRMSVTTTKYTHIYISLTHTPP